MQKFDSSDSPLGNLPAKMTSHLKSPRTRFRVEAHLERRNSSRPQRCVTAAAGVLTHGANSSALARVRPVCQCAGRCPSPAAHLPAKMTLKSPARDFEWKPTWNAEIPRHRKNSRDRKNARDSSKTRTRDRKNSRHLKGMFWPSGCRLSLLANFAFHVSAAETAVCIVRSAVAVELQFRVWFAFVRMHFRIRFVRIFIEHLITLDTHLA